MLEDLEGLDELKEWDELDPQVEAQEEIQACVKLELKILEGVGL